MLVKRVRSKREFEQFMDDFSSGIDALQRFENELFKSWREMEYRGFSYTAGQEVQFVVSESDSVNGQLNWRETLNCSVTGYNNRMRAFIQFMELEIAPPSNSDIYISEQVTPFYQHLKLDYPALVGSELLQNEVPLGQINAQGIRNEDLTRLSFENSCFDYVLSLDCIEHVPDYGAAFRECSRILRPGGTMMWSVPFSLNAEVSTPRALLLEDGTIEHLYEPEYHGDPLTDSGCLCFTHFGWNLLDSVRDSGFEDVYALLYAGREFGYLGGVQQLFFATKGAE